MKDKKVRVPIPKEIAADVLYIFDRTCCVCNEKGKSVQIHHIDEDPSNNSKDNLAILCFDCHEETQIRGGFGRKLDAGQINRYKQEWIQRVKERRSQADSLASLKTTGSEKLERFENLDINYSKYLDTYFEEFELTKYPEKNRLRNYIDKIAEIKQTVYKYAQPDWDSDATQTMTQASYDVVSFYEEILNELSTFYPYQHFENDSKKFFSEIISSKYKWNRYVLDTFGIGKNGTIISVVVADVVTDEIDFMVVKMVTSLCEKYQLDTQSWVEKWSKIKRTYY